MKLATVWAAFVVRRWKTVLGLWIGTLLLVRLVAPAWDSVTEDGDFQYLPERCASVAGQRLLDSRFGGLGSRSHVVAVVARDEPLGDGFDALVAYDVARRLERMAADSLLMRATDAEDGERRRELAERALERYAAAIDFTQSLYERPPAGASLEPPWFDDSDHAPLAVALIGRARALELLDRKDEAQQARTTADAIDPKIGELPAPNRSSAPSALPIEKVWTWKTDGIGSALMDLRGNEAVARLVVLHLSTEFLAVENVETFERVRAELEAVRRWAAAHSEHPPEIGLSGSAAVGSDLLVASAEAVGNTEWATLICVTIILAFVYRAPLLILIPMVTIGVALQISLGLLASATRVDLWTGWEWWTFGVFKTTRIFVVVILFGAGTDFCLFLIARMRENLAEGLDRCAALEQSLVQVAPALAASALTTILGLGMMAFAEFGKLAHSGPAIGIALAVTLLACLTLTPALLVALGGLPFGLGLRGETPRSDTATPWRERFWERLGEFVVRRPSLILTVSVLAMLPLAILGWDRQHHVTYDLLAGLDRTRPSRAGTDLLRRHFPVGESGPVVLLARLPVGHPAWMDGEPTVAASDGAGGLAAAIESLPGVDYVRSLDAPLGHRGRPGGTSQQMVRAFPQVRAIFLAEPVDPSSVSASTEPSRAPPRNLAADGGVLRFDVVLEQDPFSIAATDTVGAILALAASRADQDRFWTDAEFSVAGTTAAVRDLRQVTVSDTRRIELLVIAAVYLVLVAILRHPIVCAYMILSVVFSYLVTVGLSDLVFAYAYGDDYRGLEWKVPLFLFVILVAVGEDYNVYLASRVFEEQERLGPFAGLRRAIAKTGGIISSCGAIMAGTFVSMTAPVWYLAIPEFFGPLRGWATPEGGSLQGMIQMGFALTIGVLLDTFVVRPVLLPAFLAITARYQVMRRR